MNAAKQAAWFFCALIVLAYSGLYFASSTSEASLKESSPDMVDAIVSHLTVKQFDVKGKLANYLQTPEVRHIPHQNTHFLKSPYLILSQPNQPAWKIAAHRAKATNNGEVITFSQQVIIHRKNSKYAQESTIKTEELTYFSKNKLASTDLAISFEQPGSIIHAKGMRAYLDDKRIQLLSQAHASYDPKHS